MPVAAVLWDADGVLQRGAESWSDAFGRLYGDLAECVYTDLAEVMSEALAGRVDMLDHIDEVLTRHGLGDARADTLAVWEAIEPLPDVRAVAAGLSVPSYLATNQDSWRADCMRRLLEYDEIMAGCYYSCDLGVAKPAPAYFTAIADDLAVPPESLLFVDDRPDNVAGAREAGLAAEVWHHDDGVECLGKLLVAHGL